MHQQHTTERYADRRGQGPSIINFRTREDEKQVHVPAVLNFWRNTGTHQAGWWPHPTKVLDSDKRKISKSVAVMKACQYVRSQPIIIHPT